MDTTRVFKWQNYELLCSAKPVDAGRFAPNLIISKQVWPTRPREIAVPRGQHTSRGHRDRRGLHRRPGLDPQLRLTPPAPHFSAASTSAVLRTRPRRGNIFSNEFACVRGVGAAGGVLGEHDVVAQLPRVARGRFHADRRRDAGQHDGPDAAAAQLQVQLGAVERAPLALQDVDVAGLRAAAPAVSSSQLAGGAPGGFGASTVAFSASPPSAEKPTFTSTTGAFAARNAAASGTALASTAAESYGALRIGKNALLQVDQHQRRGGGIQLQGAWQWS